MLEFGNSDATKVGEWVMAIGNPFGLGHTVTAGIVSAKGRHIGAGPFDSFLQTDASINPGNSGGPLIDLDGRVVGINTAIVPNGQGIGFATPASMADKIIQQLKNGKKISRGWLGITMQELDENTAKAVGLKDTKGVLVAHVIPGDPADKGGLKIGDVIMKLNGQAVDGSNALLARIASLRPGEKIQLGVWRQNRMTDLTITLGERKPNFVPNSRTRAPRHRPPPSSWALACGPWRAARRPRPLACKSRKGLWCLRCSPGRPAAQIDIQPGDVVIEGQSAGREHSGAAQDPGGRIQAEGAGHAALEAPGTQFVAGHSSGQVTPRAQVGGKRPPPFSQPAAAHARHTLGPVQNQYFSCTSSAGEPMAITISRASSRWFATFRIRWNFYRQRPVPGAAWSRNCPAASRRTTWFAGPGQLMLRRLYRLCRTCWCA